jgi:gluconolactonase
LRRKAQLVLLLIAGLTHAPGQSAKHFELKAYASKFWELLDHHAEIETIGTGFGFTEGPVYDPSGFLYISDEEQNKLYRLYLDGRKETVVALGDPDGNTYDAQQRLLDCASVLRAIIRVSPNGQYSVLADPALDVPKGEKQELSFQGVFRLDAQGRVKLLVKDMSQPNGLAFSPDGKRLYVDDSEQKNIRVFDFGRDGTVRNERLFGTENEAGGVPDGMRLDTNGNLYVVGPKGIWVWDAQGNHLGTIETPEQPANLAWGNHDYGSLYITATTSVYRIRTKARGSMPNLRK